MLVVLISLCAFSPAFCKGKIADLDAFETYIGKTEEEVLLIRPNAFVPDGDWKAYCVDGRRCNDEGILMMLVGFDEETEMVNSVTLMISGCSELNLSGDSSKALALALLVLGLDAADIENLEEKDGALYAVMKNNVVCSVTETDHGGGDTTVFTGCVQF